MLLQFFLFLKKCNKKIMIMRRREQHPLRTSLGLTQLEIAMLLGVSRGRWSMFELGKRDLPLSATILMGDMLTHLQAAQIEVKPTLKEQQILREQLMRELSETEFQQLKLSRMITVIKKKQEAQNRLSGMLDYLDARNTTQSKSKIATPRAIVAKTMSANHAAPLLELELKQELLEFKKTLLESKIKK